LHRGAFVTNFPGQVGGQKVVEIKDNLPFVADFFDRCPYRIGAGDQNSAEIALRASVTE